LFFGWRCAYPTYTTPTPMLAQRRRAIAAGTEPRFCRAAADAVPGLRGECAGILAGGGSRHPRPPGASPTM
ncbi:hypothetical protein ACJ2BB_11240, partial [Klebsiella pneumoniae]|uniref:hypothetical protein n=1 Tax=Klebsiella pneumoniae TaxID=573 RepID=UPI003896EF77